VLAPEIPEHDQCRHSARLMPHHAHSIDNRTEHNGSGQAQDATLEGERKMRTKNRGARERERAISRNDFKTYNPIVKIP